MSLPIVLIAIGAVVFSVPGVPAPDIPHRLAATERVAEIGVLVALMGAGLTIDRPVGRRTWATTWRLLGIAMPVTIAATALAGWAFAGLTVSAAVLLGAVIAPTDPVLAADVQVGEPTTDDDAIDDAEDQVRFTLTSEAGLNDGLAFPFVYMAIAIGAHPTGVLHWLPHWIAVDVGARIAIGLAFGWIIGRLLAAIVFNPPGPLQALADSAQGFVAVAATLLAYGLTELAHGYGFIAVFVTALTLRHAERHHDYHRVLHDFAHQLEQLIIVGVLVVFGGALATGLLGDLTVRGTIIAIAVIFVFRPAAARLALLRSDTTRAERRAIEFFGIRGIGSLYYLAFAATRADIDHIDELWSTVAFTILLSIVIHGVTATPVMNRLDRRRARRSLRTN